MDLHPCSRLRYANQWNHASNEIIITFLMTTAGDIIIFTQIYITYLCFYAHFLEIVPH